MTRVWLQQGKYMVFIIVSTGLGSTPYYPGTLLQWVTWLKHETHLNLITLVIKTNFYTVYYVYIKSYSNFHSDTFLHPSIPTWSSWVGLDVVYQTLTWCNNNTICWLHPTQECTLSQKMSPNVPDHHHSMCYWVILCVLTCK